MKKINLILPEIEISDNIAIIGSSANLLKTEYGEEINKYDDVIRFNRSPIIGYEKYVGEKTTMRVVNLHVFQGMKPDGRFNIKNQNPKFIKNVKNCKIIPLKHKPHFGDGKKFVHETSTVHYMDNSLLKGLMKTYNLNKEPTAGFMMLHILIKNGLKPTLYGFGVNEKNKPSHYWEKLNISIHHNLNRERIIIQNWEKDDKIIIKL